MNILGVAAWLIRRYLVSLVAKRLSVASPPLRSRFARVCEADT
jgi:hypothetical protein